MYILTLVNCVVLEGRKGLSLLVEFLLSTEKNSAMMRLSFIPRGAFSSFENQKPKVSCEFSCTGKDLIPFSI